MSGGAFDYQQYRIGEIADQIEEVVIRHSKPQPSNDWFVTKPETLAEMRKAIIILRQAEVYAQRIDWFLSGDDGEESFHKRLAEELLELKNEKNRGPNE